MESNLENVVTQIFLACLALKFIAETFLDLKNKNYILKNKHSVPEKFQNAIELKEHQKAADYSATKINTSIVFNILSYVILLVWTLGGGLNVLNEYTLQFNLSPILQGVFYLALFSLISMLLGLPQSIYQTFVVEEKFGFNKMTPALFIKDLFKGLILGALLILPLFAALLWLMQSLGSNWWIYGWLLVTCFQFIILWAYPRFIAPLFNKFSPLEEGEVKEKVESLLQRTGFKSNGLFVMDASIRSSHGNAYFTGFGKNKRIVFFDTLIKSLKAEEVEAVLAHELGHFKRKHVTKMLIRSTMMSFLAFALMGFLLTWKPFFLGHGVSQTSTYLGLILFSLVSGIYTFFLTPVTSWISRRYEFEADQFASEHANADDLISALVKLYKENASTLTPDPLYSSFYHSHPPALVRVEFLESLKA